MPTDRQGRPPRNDAGPVAPGKAAQALLLLLRAGRKVTIEVGGASMEPLIKPGDRVEVVPVGNRRLRRGEVVLFQEGDDLVVHRVLQLRQSPGGEVVRQKGDAASVEGQVPYSSVLGRVSAVLRPDGARVNLEGRRVRWAAGAAVLLDRACLCVATRCRAARSSHAGPDKGGRIGRRLAQGLRKGIRRLYLAKPKKEG